MHYEQDDADDEGDVNEGGGYVKCEKSQQPKNDQYYGNYRKHNFISPAFSRIPIICCFPLRPVCLEEGIAPHRKHSSRAGAERMSRLEHCDFFSQINLSRHKPSKRPLSPPKRVRSPALIHSGLLSAGFSGNQPSFLALSST